MGATLGLSRAAVHKHVQALVNRGVPIHRVPGRGYRLAEGVTLLDESSITGQLSSRTRPLVRAIDILDEVDSTSATLAAGAAERGVDGRICLAEIQTAGRGRRGRGWVATPYRDLMMSVGVEYPQWPAQLQTLSLVTALLIVRALRGLGISGLRVKWPNDLVHDGRKLGGILMDVTGEAHGACRVIAGIGINVVMGREQGRAIDGPWTDLEAIAGGALDRNRLAAACLNDLMPGFRAFPEDGFTPYLPEWRCLDALRGRVVAVHGAEGATVSGRAEGVDETGRLLVIDAAGETHLFTQGDVSVQVQ